MIINEIKLDRTAKRRKMFSIINCTSEKNYEAGKTRKMISAPMFGIESRPVIYSVLR